MTPEEQKRLADEIAQYAAEHVKKQIDAGKIPEDWDGVELRWYLCERIEWHSSDKKRKKKYYNHLIVNNL